MTSPRDQAGLEYVEAFKTAKRAKNACLFAILLALSLEGACFVAVRFLGVIDADGHTSGRIVKSDGRRLEAHSGVLAPAGETGPTGDAAADKAAALKAKADAAKAAADKAAALKAKADADKAAADKAAALKAKADADKAAADKAAALKAKADADKAAADKAAVLKAKADAAKATADKVAADKAAATKARSASTPAGPTSREVSDAIVWKAVMTWVLHATKLLTPVVALLLIISILFAVSISLLGRLGRISGLVGAFFWAVILLVLVMPWQEILQDRYACGAMYDLRELTAETSQVLARWGAVGVTPLKENIYYARFAGLPAVALLVWVVVIVKFACGCKGIAGLEGEDEQDADALVN